MVRPLSPLFHNPLLHDILLVVDTAVDIYFYLSSRHALTRQRLL